MDKAKFFNLFNFNYLPWENMTNKWEWPEEHVKPLDPEVLNEMVKKHPESFQFYPKKAT